MFRLTKLIIVFLWLYTLASCNGIDVNALKEEQNVKNQAKINEARQLVDKGELQLARLKIDSIFLYNPSIRSDSGLVKMSQTVDSLFKIRKDKVINSLMPKIRKTSDDMRGLNFYEDATSPKFVNYNGFFAYISEDVKSKSYTLFLKIQYTAEDWLFIQKYTVKTDDDIFDIIPVRQMLTDHDGGEIWEVYNESVDALTLKRIKQISESKTAKIRHEGREYYKDRIISEKEKQALKRILDLYSAFKGEI